MASYDWYGDTDPKAFEVFIDLQRKMAPGDKLAAVFDMIDLVRGSRKPMLGESIPTPTIARFSCGWLRAGSTAKRWSGFTDGIRKLIGPERLVEQRAIRTRRDSGKARPA